MTAPTLNELDLSIEYVCSSLSVEDAFKRYSAILANHGYDRVLYTLATDHHSLDLPATHGLVNSYPEDWMSYYHEQGYLAVDAVVQKGLASRVPFYWDDLFQDSRFSKESLEVVSKGGEAGVKDGLSMSFLNTLGEMSGVSIARSNNGDLKKDYDFLAKAYLLSVHFFETFVHFHKNEKDEVKLTQREQDILCWASEGKPDREIASVLCVSFDTIRFHWKNIFTKFQVTSKTHAVAKSIRLGMMAPVTIGFKYHQR